MRGVYYSAQAQNQRQCRGVYTPQMDSNDREPAFLTGKSGKVGGGYTFGYAA